MRKSTPPDICTVFCRFFGRVIPCPTSTTLGRVFLCIKPARATEKEQNPAEVEGEEVLPALWGIWGWWETFPKSLQAQGEVIPLNPPGDFGLSRISWDVSPCGSTQNRDRS